MYRGSYINNSRSIIGTWGVTEEFRFYSGSNYKDYTVVLPEYELVVPVYENQATIRTQNDGDFRIYFEDELSDVISLKKGQGIVWSGNLE